MSKRLWRLHIQAPIRSPNKPSYLTVTLLGPFLLCFLLKQKCHFLNRKNRCFGRTRLRTTFSKKEKCGPGCMGPVTWCGLLPGLVGSQFQNEPQIRWSSLGSGTEARHAQSLVNINQNYPQLDFGPILRTSTPVERPCLKAAVRCLIQVVAT